ncbi:MAG: polysaccharide deacetylase family protein [Candidatus Dormibacteraeota bacterium]|nr:polysaccharide deacetylase family protein [Candidatus Dormibacteraeota bacterium]
MLSTGIRAMTSAPVLLYHAVGVPRCTPNSEERDLFVEPRAFGQQMAQLAARGYRSLTLDEYAAAVAAGAFRPRSLLLTFDDAYAHVADVVTPVLRRHGFTAVMFVPWQHLGGRNSWDLDHPNLAALEIATPELLKEMIAGPWELASHGMDHVDLTQLEAEERRAQLTAAREGLSDLVGRPVRDLAYPYGVSNRSTRDDALLTGYRMAFTAETFETRDPLQQPRRPIKGGDSLLTFWLKTSSSCAWLYHRAPSAARDLARLTLEAASHV